MASDPSFTQRFSLIERVKTILFRPKEAWPEVARDHMPSGELFTRYAAPLAAIGPACLFLSSQLFGKPFSLGLFAGAYRAIASYGVSLAGLLIMSFVAARLAKRYNGEGSPRDAFKLIAYSSTAAWIAGAFVLVPPLSFLSIAGLYSFYLFRLGVGPIMKVPEEKQGPFSVVTIGCAILLGMASNLLVASPTWNWGGGDGRGWGWHRPPIVHVQHDDGRDFDARDFRNLAREIRDAVRKGRLEGVPPADLAALLPADIGAFHRMTVNSEARGPGGSEAEGNYAAGDREMTLKIVDLAGFGGLAQLGMTFDVDQNRDDADGYEHLAVKDGKATVEKWDRDDKSGTYATMVDKRFLIVAEGEADGIDQLKSAVATIEPARLKALEQKALPSPE
jgi:hypothetical protein